MDDVFALIDTTAIPTIELGQLQQLVADGIGEDPQELRDAARIIARCAGHLVVARRAELLGGIGAPRAQAGAVTAKSTATDPVTVVDQECERFVRGVIAQCRPSDALCGEEEAFTEGSSGLTWHIDPIDGTVNFVHGLAGFAVSIAVARGEELLAGAVCDCTRGWVYSAASGQGATVVMPDPVADCELPLEGPAVTTLSRAVVATGFSYSAAARAQQAQLLVELLPQVADIRRVGSAALDLCMLAAGMVDVYYEHGLNSWDFAAGALIAREAGMDVQTPSLTNTQEGRELLVAGPAESAAALREFFTAQQAWRIVGGN